LLSAEDPEEQKPINILPGSEKKPMNNPPGQ